ncbi:MAG: hypothetical protein ACI3ZQ_02110 [Candidatus Cryptobacteroides sp.]
MFSSIRNNFGAGAIQFKDVQEENYIVLNSVFSYDPENAAYLAAEVLEITVPTLSIGRSTITGVAVTYKERENKDVYDGGTFAKSWIKDANTLCVEKLSEMEGKGEVTVYIQALYAQLARPSNTEKSVKKSLDVKSTDCPAFDSTDSFVIVKDRWVFYSLMFDRVSYAYEKLDWVARFRNMPEDIIADIPVFCPTNYNHPNLGGFCKSRLEEGFWSLLAEDRINGFVNSSDEIFSFAFLVRDSEPEPEVEGRLRIASEVIKGTGYVQMTDFDFEFVPSPSFAAVKGRTGQYGNNYAYLYPESIPEGMPACESYLLASMITGKGLGIQLVQMELKNLDRKPEIDFIGISGERNLTIDLADTSVAVNL